MRKMATSDKLTRSRSSPKLSTNGNISQQKHDLEAVRKEKENLLREVIILRSNFNSKKIEEEIKKNRLNIVELTSGQMYQDALKSAEDQLKIYHDGGYRLINDGNEDAAKLREELNRKIVENKYLQEQCQKHDYAVRNFQDRLSFQENKNDQQAKRIRELSAEIERLTKERDLMKKEEKDLETAKDEISSLKGELKSARVSIEKHQSALDVATSQLHEVQEKHRKEICSKDLEINQYKEKLADEVRNKDLEISQLKQEYCNLEKKIKQTESSESKEKENKELSESFQKRLEVAESLDHCLMLIGNNLTSFTGKSYGVGRNQEPPPPRI
ncbi:hypothetical protein CHS0354_009721 [Potamilus streckersoni]|uniref:Uncharacterized protein n=1 Tax=Potamilus streckersoni TaxID=2493646 RepID=A0AAE0VM18_9BIVA|nr:hypothetical protein CHS0354_009721 [Potamilus streckersoni]